MYEMHKPVDLFWRLDDYSFTVNANLQRVYDVKGEARRDLLLRYFNGQLPFGLPEDWLGPSLPRADREFLQLAYHHFAAGEFLPDRRPGEVEIARIVLETRPRQVVAVYARHEAPGWQVRLVDENGGQSLGAMTTLLAWRPLSRQDLVDFILDGFDLVSMLQHKVTGEVRTVEDMHPLFKGFSPFDWGFDRALKQVIAERLKWSDWPGYPKAAE